MAGQILQRSNSVVFLILVCGVLNAEDYKIYFGNLHAHSNLTDGNTTISPKEAYKIARTEGKLDFLSLSEHNHMLTPEEMEELRQAAEEETSSNFVALFGQEYSTIKKGFNHTNIQNYPVAIPESLNGKYRQVFEQIIPNYLNEHPGTIIVAGFNHPDNFATDYGLQKDFGGDINAFVKTFDPIVHLIAICNGPADANNKDFVPANSNRFMHRDTTDIKRWFAYLSYGMHLAPKIDHDTHSPTYGFRVAGRTAVWIKGELTKEKLLRALFDRHCYATEDMNLKALAAVNEKNLPGDILKGQSGGKMKIELNIEDPDEPNAKYKIETLTGVSCPGGESAVLDSATKERTGNGQVSIEITPEQDIPTYFVVHLIQTSDDPVSKCSKDDAWLSPIWIEWDELDDHSESSSFAFVGSKNSNVYHYPQCSYAKIIKPQNLVGYNEPPEGKKLHQGCPQ